MGKQSGRVIDFFASSGQPGPGFYSSGGWRRLSRQVVLQTPAKSSPSQRPNENFQQNKATCAGHGVNRSRLQFASPVCLLGAGTSSSYLPGPEPEWSTGHPSVTMC